MRTPPFQHYCNIVFGIKSNLFHKKRIEIIEKNFIDTIHNIREIQFNEYYIQDLLKYLITMFDKYQRQLYVKFYKIFSKKYKYMLEETTRGINDILLNDNDGNILEYDSENENIKDEYIELVRSPHEQQQQLTNTNFNIITCNLNIQIYQPKIKFYKLDDNEMNYFRSCVFHYRKTDTDLILNEILYKIMYNLQSIFTYLNYSEKLYNTQNFYEYILENNISKVTSFHLHILCLSILMENMHNIDTGENYKD